MPSSKRPPSSSLSLSPRIDPLCKSDASASFIYGEMRELPLKNRLICTHRRTRSHEREHRQSERDICSLLVNLLYLITNESLGFMMKVEKESKGSNNDDEFHRFSLSPTIRLSTAFLTAAATTVPGF